MNVVINLLLFILILGAVVLVHEFGHFIFSKIFGVKVFEFSIGMGPKALQRTAKDGTKYSIRWIPIGGYVSLAGEDTEQDESLGVKKGESLNDKPAWQRCIIMIMGVVNNFLFAFIILFISALIYGAADTTPVIKGVTENSPASIAGLESGDKILKINNRKVTYTDDISLYFVVEDLDKELSIEVEKKNSTVETYTLIANKKVDEENKATYTIGIELNTEKEYGLLPSIEFAFKKSGAIFKQMFTVLGSLFTGQVSVKELSGPVGIYSVVGEARSYGINSLLYLVALLCINVGVINILPFPAFDGGRVFLLIIEKIIRRPISPKVENAINSVGFILLMILMIYVTFNDILRLF